MCIHIREGTGGRLRMNIWDRLFERVKEDFGGEEHLIFIETLEKAYNDSLTKWESNKKNYFKNQIKMNRYKPAKDIVKGLYNQKTIFISILAMGSTGIIESFTEGKGELLNDNFSSDIQVVVNSTVGGIFSFFGIFLIIGAIATFWLFHVYKGEAKVRQYGETWIRHEAFVYNFRREMLMYDEEIGDYKGKSLEEKKDIFKNNILSVLDQNEKKFQENMCDIE